MISRLLRGSYSLLRTLKTVVFQMPNAIAQASAPSYYPEKERKPKSKRITENIQWLLKYKEVNRFYTLYGLDVVGAPEANKYKDYLGFMNERNAVNRPTSPDSQCGVLRDKFLFWKYLQGTNVRTPEVFALFIDGQLYDTAQNPVEQKSFLENEVNYFVKDISGECASFVKRIKDYSDFVKYIQIFLGGGIHTSTLPCPV